MIYKFRAFCISLNLFIYDILIGYYYTTFISNIRILWVQYLEKGSVIGIGVQSLTTLFILVNTIISKM